MKKIVLSTIGLTLFLFLVTSSVLAQGVDLADSRATKLAEHVPGELLIRFSPWMNSAQVAKQMSDMGVARKREVPAIGVYLVKLPPGLSVEDALVRFGRRPGIEYLEPNYILHIASASLAELDPTWGLTKIRALDAWLSLDEATKQNEVLVATVDTGIDFSKSDISTRKWANVDETPGNGIDDDSNGYVDDTWGWDFVNNDNNPTDDHMHGTAVSGVMVATGPGVQGVCPWCKVMAVKVLSAQGSGTLDVVANGITYAAENGARVINLSLAGAVGSQTLESAVNFAWTQGTVVVAAAGNDGLKTTVYPAGYTNAIAVGSTNAEDKHSCFSNYNDGYISVTAPGEAIYVIDINDSATGYNYYSGTSLAAPHVAGLAGLIFGQNPERNNVQVRSIIENSAIDLGSEGVDAVFGHGRIDAYQAVTGETSEYNPPGGLSSNSNDSTAYAHARKLVRDGSGTLHMIWHTKDGSLYRIRYATSTDNGLNWDLQPDVFSSLKESYHSALAADNDYLYVAIPSRADDNLPYQILFTRKPLAGGAWSQAVSIMGGSYDTVLPNLYLDPSNGRLHLIASSYDKSPYLYYRASNTQGETWEQLSQFNPSNTSDNLTRYAVLHANGNEIYVVVRTVQYGLILNMFTVHSTNGGQNWVDQTHISSHFALASSEYGISLAGVGDRVYMGYEVGTSLYFRRNDGQGWSEYETLETGDSLNIYKWPTITQAADGQAWMIFEVNKELYMRHYDGSTWQSKESLGPGTYANFKLGTSDNQMEWVYTSCSGSPFDLVYESRLITGNSPPQADDQNVSTEENTFVNITLTGSDPDGDLLTFSVQSGPTNGSLSGTAPNLTYTPDPGFNGSDSFTFLANDGQVDSNTATVSITVNAVNDPPVAEDQSVSTSEDTPVAITLTASDVDGGLLTYSVVSGPANGSLSGTAPNLTYTPDLDFTGLDSFTFVASDGLVDSNVATVSIMVTSPVTFVDAFASGEIFVAGTVSGDYTYTQEDGGDIELLTERESGGKPINRYSFLEHKWIVSVVPGNIVTLYVDAWSSVSSDGDTFIFAYSTDDTNYVEMFTIDSSGTPSIASYSLPPSTQGTIYVRVTDSDHNPGKRALDNLYVDYLYIRSESLGGNPPTAPTNLLATPVAATQIDLDWDDVADERGFYIERSQDGISWSQIYAVGADVTIYQDTTVSPNTTYNYRVQAFNAAGLSTYSNIANATTPNGINLEANGYKVKGLQIVDLTWSGGMAPFIVFRDGNQVEEAVYEVTYTDNINAKGGGSYLYQVCETDNPTNCSNTIQVDF